MDYGVWSNLSFAVAASKVFAVHISVYLSLSIICKQTLEMSVSIVSDSTYLVFFFFAQRFEVLAFHFSSFFLKLYVMFMAVNILYLYC